MTAGARGTDAGGVQRRERLDQPGPTPVHHVIVREHAAIEPRGGETAHVRRMHPVMNAFVGPRAVGGRHGRLEIDDADVGTQPIERRQRVAPDVGIVHRFGQRPVRVLGERYVLARRLDVGFVQARIAGVRQHLVDAAAGHHVTAKE